MRQESTVGWATFLELGQKFGQPLNEDHPLFGTLFSWSGNGLWSLGLATDFIMIFFYEINYLFSLLSNMQKATILINIHSVKNHQCVPVP